MLRSVFRIPSRSLYSKVPKTFYNVPYNEQYEQRDFVWEKTISKQYKDISIPSLKDLVNVDADCIPGKLTITNIISLELMNSLDKSMKAYEIDSSMKNEEKDEGGRRSPW